MIPRAIEQAEARLARATESLAVMEASNTFEEFEPAWSSFLLALGGIYSKLEQGAKSPESASWFALKKRERRQDPLLSYFHQARNADEHGIEPVVHRGGARLAFGVPGEAFTVHIKEFSETKTDYTVTSHIPGKGVTVVHEPVVARLIPVCNSRYGDVFNPPTEHLGTPIKEAEAKPAARLALSYASRMIEEAKELPASQ